MSKLKSIQQFLVCIVIAAYSTVGYSQSAVAYSKHLKSVAPDIRVITMYYTPYTDATFDSDAAMKAAASYSTQINCFLNCGMYMKKIIDQFSNSRSVICPSMMGTRYLLIEFVGKNIKIDINYLKWGNVIVYNGDCFYNKQSIDAVAPLPQVIDGLLKNSKPKMERR